MAGSRLEKFGTVFTRVRDLMRSGVIRPEQKPVWYDVYKAFPPRRDPLYVKLQGPKHIRKPDSVPQIFYAEDQVRASFYEQYGTGSRSLDLSKPNFISTCQRFLDKYTELQRRGQLDEASLFEETGKALLAEGLILRKRGAPPVSVNSRESVPDLKLTEMLAEQQSGSAELKETV